MKLREGIVAAAVALGSLTAVQSVRAAIIVNDNFDTYANQAAFEAVWTPIGTVAPLSAVLSSTQSASPTQSIYNPATGTTSNQYRNQLTFSETTFAIGDQLVWSFDFWDNLPAGNPQRNHSNLQDGTGPSGTNQLVSMGLNNTILAASDGGNFYMGRILGYAPPATDPDGGAGNEDQLAGNWFKLNDTGAGLRSAGFHNLKVILSTDDGVATDYKFYVDNVLVETVNNVGGAGTLRSYDVLRLGSGLSNGTQEVYYDNMFLEFVAAPVPEPATAGLLLIGGAALALRRRRQA
jgi:hypothetical protein